MSLLTLESVKASYGLTQALFDVSFCLQEGEILALMGRNGMGKSTTIKTVCKMLPLQGGSLHFSGADLKSVPSHKVARMGVGLVPEGRRCFNNLTVRENLLCAAQKGYWNLYRVGELFPRLSERQGQSAQQLSGGEQQMLSIARALMTNPRLLLLDEATEGLAPLVRNEIWSVIARLKRETGLAIVVVDKSIVELKNVVDNIVVLENGRTVWTGPVDTLSDFVVERYLGV